MKKILLATAVFICAGTLTTLYAQDDEIAQIQNEWGKDKKELVRLTMDLSAADSVKFWPIYNKYEKERQKLGRERIEIIEDYAEHFTDLSNSKADELINKIFKNETALSKLHQTYYKSFKTALGAKQAAKFLQIESYIGSIVKSLLQEENPIIGELDELKKSL